MKSHFSRQLSIPHIKPFQDNTQYRQRTAGHLPYGNLLVLICVGSLRGEIGNAISSSRWVVKPHYCFALRQILMASEFETVIKAYCCRLARTAHGGGKLYYIYGGSLYRQLLGEHSRPTAVLEKLLLFSTPSVMQSYGGDYCRSEHYLLHSL